MQAPVPALPREGRRMLVTAWAGSAWDVGFAPGFAVTQQTLAFQVFLCGRSRFPNSWFSHGSPTGQGCGSPPETPEQGGTVQAGEESSSCSGVEVPVARDGGGGRADGVPRSAHLPAGT